jgi:hypothetical protein
MAVSWTGAKVMSDTRLRELERRWKETGSPDDEAAYLKERVRVGDLTQERLELAAYCGHEGARRAVRGSLPGATTGAVEWTRHLGRWPEAAAVAAVAAARMAVETVDLDDSSGARPEQILGAVRAAEAAVTQPTQESLGAARGAAEALPRGFTPEASRNALLAARYCAQAAGRSDDPRAAHQAVFHAAAALKDPSALDATVRFRVSNWALRRSSAGESVDTY